MALPFLNAIKGTTSGTPGTGSFTPNAAASGFLAWSTVPTNWVGLVRYDDGSDWELRYGFWNGTTITRASNVVASSTGSALSLTSSARAALVVDGGLVQPHLGMGMARGYTGLSGATTTPTALGVAAATVTGTAGTAAIATTNALTEVGTSQTASATTANAQAGYTTPVLATNNTGTGRGGFEFCARFGTSTTIPGARRLFVGASSATYVGQTVDPSAFTSHYAAFTLDGGDTNIQLLTNSNASTGTKIDTGIALVQNGYYHAQIWMPPGGGTVYALLIRLDTGEIYYGTTTTDIPGTATLRGHVLGGLGATTGTAFTMNMGAVILRSGGW